MAKYNKPKRIQRRRAKGWRMPENTIYVGRGSAWGNPFIVGKHGTAANCVELYTYLIACRLRCITKDSKCVDAQEALLKHATKHLKELKGKNLACWCRPDKPCHADILLVLANPNTTKGGKK